MLAGEYGDAARPVRRRQPQTLGAPGLRVEPDVALDHQPVSSSLGAWDLPAGASGLCGPHGTAAAGALSLGPVAAAQAPARGASDHSSPVSAFTFRVARLRRTSSRPASSVKVTFTLSFLPTTASVAV